MVMSLLTSWLGGCVLPGSSKWDNGTVLGAENNFKLT